MTEDAKTLERFPFTDSSPKVDEITKALFDVQVAMPLLDRTSKNDFHKSRYADLAEYWETANGTVDREHVQRALQSRRSEGRWKRRNIRAAVWDGTDDDDCPARHG